jgi:hypothetical protein
LGLVRGVCGLRGNARTSTKYYFSDSEEGGITGLCAADGSGGGGVGASAGDPTFGGDQGNSSGDCVDPTDPTCGGNTGDPNAGGPNNNAGDPNGDQNRTPSWCPQAMPATRTPTQTQTVLVF